jgi:hypothetical protein
MENTKKLQIPTNFKLTHRCYQKARNPFQLLKIQACHFQPFNHEKKLDHCNKPTDFFTNSSYRQPDKQMKTKIS